MSRVVPTVNKEGKHFDIFSRMLDDRIIFLTGEVNEDSAEKVVAELLYLEHQDDQKDIMLYINSPGGCVHSGLSIINTIEMIKPDVHTIVTGLAASMGAAILCSGTKGKRSALKDASVMIHQVSSGTRGHVLDQVQSLEHTKYLNDLLMKKIANNLGISVKKLLQDANRDLWLNAEESLKYGVIDKILTK